MVATNFSKVRRHPERGSYDKELLLDILGNGLVCHVAFQIDGQPFIIPMSYYNNSEFIFIHGSPVARISNALRSGVPVAISVMELNGLVVAKGLADNSMNYRSAIMFGKPVEVVTDEEKLSYFEEWIDQLIPGRKENTALPNQDELTGVAVFKVKLDQFSLKMRKGGPSELRKNPEIWSGVIPISTRFSSPESASSPKLPDHIQRFLDNRNSS